MKTTKQISLPTICILLSGLLSAFAIPGHAGKIYQWVDENGKRHFSQTPPPELKHKKTVINTNINASSIRPVKQSDGIYCGKLKVTYDKYASSSSNARKYLANKASRWEKSLRRAEQRLNSHIQRASDRKVVRNGQYQLRNSGRYSEDKQEYTQQVNEYRCALAWAKNTSNPDIGGLNKNYLQAKNEYQAALKQQQLICGSAPSIREDRTGTLDSYRKWDKCQSKSERAVSRLKRRLVEAESNYRDSR